MNICQNTKCNVAFEVKSNSAGLYCSRSCAATVNNSKAPKRQLQGECRNCGSVIPASRLYCGKQCQDEYREKNGLAVKKHCHCGDKVVGRGLCKKHYAEFMSEYMRNRHNNRRKDWIEGRGGVCEKCGSADRLEIDHINRKDKLYDISYAFSRFSNERMQEELAKCQVLCYDCHKIKTSDDLGVQHGGGLSGKKNCLCQLCKAKKAEYMRNRRII